MILSVNFIRFVINCSPYMSWTLSSESVKFMFVSYVEHLIKLGLDSKLEVGSAMLDQEGMNIVTCGKLFSKRRFLLEAALFLTLDTLCLNQSHIYSNVSSVHVFGDSF